MKLQSAARARAVSPIASPTPSPVHDAPGRALHKSVLTLV
jgi:hypothetical protein